jgi:uncharacterized membrane protein YedE/YeeE
MTPKPLGPRPYWNPYVGGVVLGLVLFLSFALTSHGLGASGGVARIVLAAEKVVAPDHVDRSATLSSWAGGQKNPLDAWVVWGVLGAAVGGFLSGLLGRRVKAETYKGPRISVRTRWMMALLGGTLMGFGARMGRGCTSGQALSGGAALSVGSWLLMFAIFTGAYMLAWPLRRFWTGGGAS